MQNDKVKNKTYEQYLQEVRRDVYAEAGEIVKCQNGHDIIAFVCTTFVDHEMYGKVEYTNINLPEYSKNPNPFCCPECNSVFIKKIKNIAKYSTGFQFWMDGEWRERKYK